MPGAHRGTVDYDQGMHEPNERRLRVNGVDLQLYEWAGSGPPIFLAHATGFHARCWDEVVRLLPGRQVFAIDMRGHGQSEKLPPPYPWRRFGEDMAAVARAIGLAGAVGVGHSKGGYAVALGAALAPGTFRSLLLVDPVILARAAYSMPRAEGDVHFAARRRNHWPSVEAMFERFRERPPFSGWKERVLRDYCTYGLVPNPEGDGYVLACPPEIEAAVYAGSAGGDISAELATLDIPVVVMRARQREGEGAMDMSGSPTDPGLAATLKHGIDRPVYHLTHFIPMEDPGLVAREILALADR
jgi:lipase